MRTAASYLISLLAAAGAAAAIAGAPIAGAQDQLPKCEDLGGASALGETSTECATPGNVQVVDTPTDIAQEDWGDMWGPGLFFP